MADPREYVGGCLGCENKSDLVQQEDGTLACEGESCQRFSETPREHERRCSFCYDGEAVITVGDRSYECADCACEHIKRLDAQLQQTQADYGEAVAKGERFEALYYKEMAEHGQAIRERDIARLQVAAPAYKCDGCQFKDLKHHLAVAHARIEHLAVTLKVRDDYISAMEQEVQRSKALTEEFKQARDVGRFRIAELEDEARKSKWMREAAAKLLEAFADSKLKKGGV